MIEKIKKLRQLTNAPFSECQRALKESQGDLEKALEILKNFYKEFSLKKDKETKAGIIDVYLHPNKKIGVLVQLECESDFVAKNPDFLNLAHEISLQIAATDPKNVKVLLEQNWIKDESRKVLELLQEAALKFGEKILVKKFTRYEL